MQVSHPTNNISTANQSTGDNGSKTEPLEQFYCNTFSVHEKDQRANVHYFAKRRDTHLLAHMYKRTRDRRYVEQTSRTTTSGDATLLKVSKPKKNKLRAAPVYTCRKMWKAQRN